MANSRRQTILVVDPDPSIRTLIVALLHREGYAAEAAGTAGQALALHRTTQPAAVILEPRMPGGPALIDAFVASGDGDGRAPVIVLTTPGGSRNPFADVPGVRAVLLKPFRLEELTDAVATCCDGAN